MGLLSDFFGLSFHPTLPEIQSILPKQAKKEIIQGQLPKLRTDKLFLHSGEIIHFADRAVLNEEKVQRRYISNRSGTSYPGLFRGTRHYFSGGTGRTVETPVTKRFKGILYITNQRIIFSGSQKAFEKKVDMLTGITSYSNGVVIQFNSTVYTLFVPDGNIVHQVLYLINKHI